jgi:hypothetical protein
MAMVNASLLIEAPEWGYEIEDAANGRQGRVIYANAGEG